MKIIVAPDKFKGSLSAVEVCNAIENGIKRFDQSIEVIKHPLADGGEGTLAILNNYFKLKKRNVIFYLLILLHSYLIMIKRNTNHYHIN